MADVTDSDTHPLVGLCVLGALCVGLTLLVPVGLVVGAARYLRSRIAP